MPTILAIDTSTSLASVALLRDGQIFARESSGVQTHSQLILPMMQALLAEAGIKLAQCDAIAFGAGPGSFTGVRTACGVAQGLAFGADLPTVPVITLEAMAESCREQSGATEVLTLLDASMGEVYWAQYRFHDSWQIVIPPTLSAPDAVAPATLAHGSITACGNALMSYAAAFTDSAFSLGPQLGIFPHARQVASLGGQAFLQGRTVIAHDAQPVYLRNKVAFTTAERAGRAERAERAERAARNP